MELPKYSGTIHPQEWLKQVLIFCYFKQIKDDKEVLNICKTMINSTIIIPNVNEIKSFEELIEALKLHSTFNTFKISCKRKLQMMKFIPEQHDDIATFLANFHSLCNDAEINDHEEIITLLINSYSNYFFKSEFIKRVEGINSVDEIFKIFSEVVFDELKIIKFGSSIALKHVATGKYLSSCNVNYKTGSNQRVVFAGEKFPDEDALWYATTSHNFQHCTYDDGFDLTHKVTGNKLGINSSYRSPTTGHFEVNCRNGSSSLNWINTNTTNNNAPYVKAKDVIALKCGISIFRSHDFTFTIGNKTFQEVVGHNERIGGNDEWQIEIV
ncbi:uncharacterized protein OCT59_013323 [Rhizophagus irregularis]|uniref:MIR domain-containing protein n=1 Tax=Rhizophagus irregularis (strain DAOM 181602 / DAOM 197198 / MUCL 43194) TaxID=747089 RepID=U9TN19_RHIID|nr:hypothetical protein OCT59_013323 [Rhizophagus irregularis]GBC27603.2 hypothetical protein GLOIN_2v1709522 [Rhizophagus irregularis DAOM 181602=DAOM 197198]